MWGGQFVPEALPTFQPGRPSFGRGGRFANIGGDDPAEFAQRLAAVQERNRLGQLQFEQAGGVGQFVPRALPTAATEGPQVGPAELAERVAAVEEENRLGQLQFDQAAAARRTPAEQQREALDERSRLNIEQQRQALTGAIGQQREIQQAGITGAGIEQQAALEGAIGRQARIQEAFQESPGQAFLRQRQEKALLRNQAAIGGLGGGNIRTALQEQAAGIAGQQFGQFQRNIEAGTGQGLRQSAIAQQGLGFGTAQGLAQTSEAQNRLSALSGVGQTTGAQLGQFGGQSAANIANLLQAGGQAQASGILGAQQVNAELAGQFAQAIALGVSSDRNIKEDINDLDLKTCFDAVATMPLKSWRYIKNARLDQDLHFGPMSQDAPEMIKIPGKEMLNVHDELMMIAGAIQYMHQMGMLDNHEVAA